MAAIPWSISTGGGVQVIVKELMDAGMLNGDVPTCTGETLAEQVARLDTPPDGDVVHHAPSPTSRPAACALLGGNLSPDYSAILKLAGVEGGLENNVFKGQPACSRAKLACWSAGQNAGGVPEPRHGHRPLRGASWRAGHAGDAGFNLPHHDALPRKKHFVGLMTDARFSGGSVGLVIGHVGPEAALGGPIALIENGDEIVADLNTNELNCTELRDPAVFEARRRPGEKVVAPMAACTRTAATPIRACCTRMRRSGVPAIQGGGMHPDRELWVNNDPREPVMTGFVPSNKHH